MKVGQHVKMGSAALNNARAYFQRSAEIFSVGICGPGLTAFFQGDDKLFSYLVS